MTPSDDRILVEIYNIRENIEKLRIKEQIMIDELKARGINLEEEMPKAVDRFMETF